MVYEIAVDFTTGLFPTGFFIILILTLLTTAVAFKLDTVIYYLINDVVLLIFTFNLIINMNSLSQIYVYLIFILVIEFLLSSFAIKDKKRNYYEEQ